MLRISLNFFKKPEKKLKDTVNVIKVANAVSCYRTIIKLSQHRIFGRYRLRTLLLSIKEIHSTRAWYLRLLGYSVRETWEFMAAPYRRRIILQMFD